MTTPARQRVHDTFAAAADRFSASRGVQRLLTREITREHYASLLRQIFHHARENPQIQALAAVAFRGAQRELVKPFLRHAVSEIGHDQLALDDVGALGLDNTSARFERPLPETSGLVAYAFHLIKYRNPVGYLGYLYFLEFLPTQMGGEYRKALNDIGVPDEAMTFLHDHMTVDVGHNKLMETYLVELVKTEEELEHVLYAIEATGTLYARMVEAAFEAADNPRPARPALDEQRFSPAA